ncbi:helix-turn-helix domain-containing protein [Hymenobacter terrenus]|uniref:helix-turn-helix domain-containing protein n=1 Tax=Hymenobacter terrenus TaxID=1629124 RepID=UPI00061A00AC|nr:helix-turn-helix domain-containing protein [Hymenobacter terrenus]
MLLVLGLTQGSITGIIFLLLRNKDRSLKWLGLFLIAYSMPFITWLFVRAGLVEKYPRIDFLPIGLHFAVMPLFYLYAKSLTSTLNRATIRRNLLPALVEVVHYTIICCLSEQAFQLFIQGPYLRVYVLVYTLGLNAFSIGYAARVIHLVQRHQDKVLGFYSDLHGRWLGWVKLTAWANITIGVLDIVVIYLIYNYVDKQLYLMLSVAYSVVMIYWVAISGLRQSNTAISFPVENAPVPISPLVSAGLPVEQLALPESEEGENKAEEDVGQQADFEQITRFMERGAYKDSDLTLAGLADQLGLSYKKVSSLINEKAGMNFNKFVNQYRVEEAKRLLSNSAYDHLNHVGIAQAAGFQTKSTFYRMFREFTGVTPNAYKKEIPH